MDAIMGWVVEKAGVGQVEKLYSCFVFVSTRFLSNRPIPSACLDPPTRSGVVIAKVWESNRLCVTRFAHGPHGILETLTFLASRQSSSCHLQRPVRSHLHSLSPVYSWAGEIVTSGGFSARRVEWGATTIVDCQLLPTIYRHLSHLSHPGCISVTPPPSACASRLQHPATACVTGKRSNPLRHLSSLSMVISPVTGDGVVCS
ncbi:hypothetical protein C0Q70_17487 [Pomacea canaliculata]|uniref:Uncharacterized protein n=1 Tax=Pomacea canaliculata TaxID=400727 RepID=A0A2T7NKJ3_POMCA|nr:hypothetical protein C0Q70_17487 [Pomacea canaliculata]